MYSVILEEDPNYGKIISICRDEDGDCKTPFEVYQKVKSINLNSKIKILVDDQLLSLFELNMWAHEEYKNLPKCQECFQILSRKLYTHQLCGYSFFCSENCANKNHAQKIESLNDLEDIEYL